MDFCILAMTHADLADVRAIDYDARVEEELFRPWANVWVLRDADGLLAAVLSTWLVVDELQVLHIATHPSRRRRGFARALLEHAVEFARTSDVRMLVLEVRSSNEAALSLYQAFGFEPIRVRTGYYPDGEDGIEMKLSIMPPTPHVLRDIV